MSEFTPLSTEEWARAMKLVIEAAGLGLDNDGAVTYAHDEYASDVDGDAYAKFLVKQAFKEAGWAKL